jgi:hypothetical protein
MHWKNDEPICDYCPEKATEVLVRKDSKNTLFRSFLCNSHSEELKEFLHRNSLGFASITVNEYKTAKLLER